MGDLTLVDHGWWVKLHSRVQYLLMEFIGTPRGFLTLLRLATLVLGGGFLASLLLEGELFIFLEALAHYVFLLGCLAPFQVAAPVVVQNPFLIAYITVGHIALWMGDLSLDDCLAPRKLRDRMHR